MFNLNLDCITMFELQFCIARISPLSCLYTDQDKIIIVCFFMSNKLLGDILRQVNSQN